MLNDAADKGADIAAKKGGKAAGAAVGGFFGGPLGAFLGAQAGKFIGRVLKPVIKLIILLVLGLIFGVFVLITTLFVDTEMSMASAPCAVFGSGTYVPDPNKTSGGGGPPNMSIVKIIIDVGRQMNMTDKQILTALAVSMIESGPRNLYNSNVPGSEKFPNDGVGHDHTSLGIFQQLSGGDGRDGKPWGTDAQLMDPAWASKRFYESLKVVDASGSLDPGLAAYKTQIPANRDHYIGIVNQNVAKAQPWLAQAGPPGPAVTDPAPASVAESPGANAATRAQSGWVKPVSANIPTTSGFGPRNSPTPGGSTNHKGQDYGTPMGTPINAANAGTVVRAGVGSGYGNVIDIDHGKNDKGEQIVTRYGHLSRILVTQGQAVTANQNIALSGNTGISSGPHLHFEVRVNGTPVDPGAFLKTAGATDTSMGANCSPVDGSLSDPGAGPRDPSKDNLTPRAYNVRQVVLAKWSCQAKNNQKPCVDTIGGYDPNHAAGSDHITGNAIDVMVSSGFPDEAQKAMGYEAYKYLQANAQALGINYLIWDGKTWNPRRNSERPYSSSQYNVRSATGGHFDHIHVSVNTN